MNLSFTVSISLGIWSFSCTGPVNFSTWARFWSISPRYPIFKTHPTLLHQKAHTTATVLSQQASNWLHKVVPVNFYASSCKCSSSPSFLILRSYKASSPFNTNNTGLLQMGKFLGLSQHCYKFFLPTDPLYPNVTLHVTLQLSFTLKTSTKVFLTCY